MTNNTLLYLLGQGYAEIVDDRVILTDHGYVSMLRLRAKRARR